MALLLSFLSSVPKTYNNHVPRCARTSSCFFIIRALLQGTLTAPSPNPRNVPEQPKKCVASTTEHGQWVLLQGTKTTILSPFTSHFKTFGVHPVAEWKQPQQNSRLAGVGGTPQRKITRSHWKSKDQYFVKDVLFPTPSDSFSIILSFLFHNCTCHDSSRVFLQTSVPRYILERTRYCQCSCNCSVVQAWHGSNIELMETIW